MTGWGMTALSGVLAGLLGACGGGVPGTGPTPVSTPTPVPAPTPSAERARYRVTLDASWAASSHPVSFPGNPHFSPLIGGTHSDRVVFWEPGATASPGVQAMAEEGAVSPLDAEVRAAVAAGTARSLIQGGGLSRSPGRVGFEFEMSRNYPRVTLVTMVAPSPDWFVGVHGLSLVEDGDWVVEKTVELAPYDAGTDSGTTYRSPDADTVPRELIRRLEGPPVASGGTVAPFGTLAFVRLGD